MTTEQARRIKTSHVAPLSPAVHRHRAELSSDPFDRLSPDHYQRDAQGVPHLTAKAKVSRAADMGEIRGMDARNLNTARGE